jgi:predicted aldo/keto reductase-like oxidoreductase
MTNKKPTQLGKTGPKVFPISLGCMGLSGVYGATDDAESVATIQAAMDAGITLLDTGDFYGMGHNEMLVGRAIYESSKRWCPQTRSPARATGANRWRTWTARDRRRPFSLAEQLGNRAAIVDVRDGGGELRSERQHFDFWRALEHGYRQRVGDE